MGERFIDGHFIGGVLAHREVSGLTLAETVYTPRLHVPAHAHDHGLVCLVLHGAFTERLGRRTATLAPGSLLYHPADEPHAHDFSGGGARCFNIQFGADWRTRIGHFGLTAPAAPLDLHRTRAAWLASRLHQEFCTADSASALSIEGFALALMAEVARAGSVHESPGARPAWLRRAEEYLQAHYLDTLGLTDLAARVEIDPSHLARTFREHHGCTISDYVRRLRVEHARRELLGTSRTLAEIAYRAGFADQAHFSRIFKQKTGLTPGAYRKLATTR
jgi:AraC family transcriptional regulator